VQHVDQLEQADVVEEKRPPRLHPMNYCRLIDSLLHYWLQKLPVEAEFYWMVVKHVSYSSLEKNQLQIR
jgi:hypothetical protein